MGRNGRHAAAHGPSPDVTGARLLIVLGLNLVIPIVQVVGGLMAGSVALISDAAHNFSDFTAVLIAYAAFLIGKKGASVKNTFGYRRAEVLAALVNVVILTAASGYIIYEAGKRLLHPEPVSGAIVMWIAGVGVIGNGWSAWLLHKDAGHSLNVRGAFLHMMGDLLTSVVVLVNGAVLMFKPWHWLDPLLSFFIVLFILKNCWSILREAGAILMNATPRDIDLVKVKDVIEQSPEVAGVHYLHAWNVSADSIAFSGHVVVEDQPVSRTEILAGRIREKLLREFGIDHAILQFETAHCGDGGLLCEMSCAGARPDAENIYETRCNAH